ncbi:alpha/beta hydrolase [Mesorhizobium sp. L-8-10]|uniref:alpha/beta hydrolase n=1 Tax=Mesorhizobium sp. L-8-10 TaxID=2744523 RepID=UPI001FD1C0B9|nr:alpha/beta hydrolase [Mesorhizobium sp. L-8-10]
MIQNVEIFDKSKFYDLSELILSRSRNYKNHVILFIHGFNVSFRDAAYVTAQIATDLNFDGLPCMYSWPSMASLSHRGYMYDTNSARQSRGRLAEFLAQIRTLKGAEMVSIIAHSMGSVALTEALRELVGNAQEKPYSQIVLAAPDMDEDDFRSVASKLTEFSNGVTLYASAHDKALNESKRMAANISRAGDIRDGAPIIVSGIDSIDASSVSNYVFGINHSYYASDRSVLSDIAALLLKGERPPEMRNPTIRRVDGSNGSYWSFP